MQLIIVTKSDKNQGWCVAGIKPENGAWVRLVKQGENDTLMDEDIMMDNGRTMGLLDVVEVEILEGVPGPAHQPENVFLNTEEEIRFIHKTSWEDVITIHPPERKRMILRNNTRFYSDRLEQSFVLSWERANSLQLVEVYDLTIHKCAEGKRHPMATFSYETADGSVLK